MQSAKPSTLFNRQSKFTLNQNTMKTFKVTITTSNGTDSATVKANSAEEAREWAEESCLESYQEVTDIKVV